LTRTGICNGNFCVRWGSTAKDAQRTSGIPGDNVFARSSVAFIVGVVYRVL